MLKESFVLSVCCLNKKQQQCRYLCKLEKTNDYACLKKTKNKLIIDSLAKEIKGPAYPVGDNCKGVDF